MFRLLSVVIGAASSSILWMSGLAVKPAIALGLAVLSLNLVTMAPAWMAGVVQVAYFWGALAPSEEFSPFKVTLVVLTLVTANRLRVRGHMNRLPVFFLLGFGLLFLVVVLREVTAPYGQATQPITEYIGALWFIVCTTQVVQDADDLRRIAIVSVVGLVFSGAWVFLEMPWANMMNVGVVRAQGPGGQSNVLGACGACAIPFALVVALDGANPAWQRLMGYVGLAAGVYCEFAANSRGGTFAFAAAVIFTACALALVTGGARRIGIVLAVLTVGFALVTLGPTSFRTRMASVLDPEERARVRDWSAERIDHVTVLVGMIPDAPVMGAGANAFVRVKNRQSGKGGQPAPHSQPLGFAAAYGVPAAVLHQGLQIAACFVAVLTARRWRRRAPYACALAGAVVAGLVLGLSSPAFFPNNTWNMVALCFVMAQRPESAAAAAIRLAPPGSAPGRDLVPAPQVGAGLIPKPAESDRGLAANAARREGEGIVGLFRA
ncbi:MAG: O-antigen ligase domain-containing protein [Myxococcales bacterium]|nr:O-antigen ligase domain-containing protein [Myxococcales bacterium]